MATLPARRRVERSPDRPREPHGALPLLEEARTGGLFSTEAFLRALVVGLAQAVEGNQGPDVTEAVVAQVGANVGGQMEAAYREARGVTGRLSNEQMADLFVRLKGAIGGDFYVISVDDEKIVLGNRRCPFGSEVEREPTLCRMTSSVFGGVAARNADGSSVVLAERIAVGDRECRVVVWLGANKREGAGFTGPGDAADSDPELIDACGAAMRGEEFLYPDAVMASTRDSPRDGEHLEGHPKPPLTPRENEVVKLIADSYTGKEIAEQLVISEKTVEHHRGNVLSKLGVRDRVALTRYAIRRGLIEA